MDALFYKKTWLLALLAMVLPACRITPDPQARAIEALVATSLASAAPSPMVLTASPPPGPTAGATQSPAPAPTATPRTERLEPSLTPAPTWAWNPPGEVIAPILLYHHVSDRDKPSRYFVSPAEFERQMLLLQRWGYTAIPLSLLVKALTGGAELPPRPVVITFDDGYFDVFENALPLMNKLGFPGVVYMITGQIDTPGYLHTADLLDLADAGWEIGSHSETHENLRKPGVKILDEVEDTRTALEDLLGVKVRSFSFPYGQTSEYITKIVRASGYKSAVGLGGQVKHTLRTQYYLSRIEVRGDEDLDAFKEKLPWKGNVINLKREKVR